MAGTDPNTCPDCTDGISDGSICRTCMGRSTVPIRTIAHQILKEQFELLDDILDKIADNKEKINEIKDVVDDILEAVS